MVERSPSTATPFLPYLEGVRGAAALIVVLYHVRQMLEPHFAEFGPTANLLPFRGQFLSFGHFGVAVFIVISGFVLTLPIAVRSDVTAGRRAFFARRARRLLPAYYAALTLSIPLWLIYQHQIGEYASLKGLVGQYLSHALLVQDFAGRTIYGLNGPLWSVAVEVQIYIVFMFVLLPVFRKSGLVGMIVTAFAIGFLPTIYGAARHLNPYPLESACFWYLGLFALGSAAAYITYDGAERFRSIRVKVPWAGISVIAAAAFVFKALPTINNLENQTLPAADVLLGIAVAAAFIVIANLQVGGRSSIVATIFSSRPMVLMGTFSYSLYLIHYPIISIAMTAIQPLPPAQKLAVTFLVLVPAVIAIAYLFSKVFEAPFMSSGRRLAEERALSGKPNLTHSTSNKPGAA